MDLSSKLRILADAAKYDASCASSGARRANDGKSLGSNSGCGVCHSYTPDGRCISLLKVLLTNYCIYDCVFCVNRVSSDIERTRFTPAEVINLTLDFYRRNYIEGLFLSSGIIQSPDYTMEQLITVARTLRTEHRFAGYIHLKAIPGSSTLLLDEAGRWADRLSANIELPTQTDLDTLAPEKQVPVIESTMQEIKMKAEESRVERKRTRRAPRFAPAGQSTQLIVGATPSTDSQILRTADRLYGSYGLRRVYYSAFSPFPKADARLPIQAPPLLREHRLYQADWLLRYYGFTISEVTEEPNLDMERDPKLAWALRHREFFPIDINNASREALLRVPGLGYRNANRILSIRRYHRLTLADLAKLRVALTRLKPFVITADFNPDALQLDRADLPQRIVQPQQMGLFQSALEAQSGEL
ncbi:MAG TPA: putative DNA modification/repair radical SAM protein [Terriglobales bacterium]|nr:putative DNA modification/repair radical SAM protein [Terriglobales bacterium]